MRASHLSKSFPCSSAADFQSITKAVEASKLLPTEQATELRYCSQAYQSSTIRLSLSSASSAVVGTSATTVTTISTLPIVLRITIAAKSPTFAMSYRTQFSTRLAQCSALELYRAHLVCLICTYPMKIA